MRPLFITLLAVGATACTAIPDAFRNDPRMTGQSAQYVRGFYDGVRTGRHLSGNYLTAHSLDVGRYRSDIEYRKGWHVGLDAALEPDRQH